MSGEDSVLVVDRPLPATMNALGAIADYRFVPRATAETSSVAKQVIPYIVVGSPAGVLTYQRASSTTERRLRGAWAIGWGGHIEPIDQRGAAQPLRSLVRRCAEREIGEELGLPPARTRVELGLIDDETDEVGRYHIGWAEYWHYPEVAVEIDAGTAGAVQWAAPDDPDLRTLAFERWSCLALDALLRRPLPGRMVP